MINFSCYKYHYDFIQYDYLFLGTNEIYYKEVMKYIDQYPSHGILTYDEKWINKLNPKDDDEESMLDQAFDVKKNSRLSCQINLNDDLDGLKLELAPE